MPVPLSCYVVSPLLVQYQQAIVITLTRATIFPLALFPYFSSNVFSINPLDNGLYEGVCKIWEQTNGKKIFCTISTIYGTPYILHSKLTLLNSISRDIKISRNINQNTFLTRILLTREKFFWFVFSEIATYHACLTFRVIFWTLLSCFSSPK